MGLLDPPSYRPQQAVPPGAAFTRPDPGVFADMDTSGYQGVLVELRGTFSATAITYETSIDGTNWVTIQGHVLSPANLIGSAVGSGTGYFLVFATLGMRFRVRASAVGSGNPNVFCTLIADLASVARSVRIAIGPQAHDSAIVEAPVRIAGACRTTNWTATANNDVTDFAVTSVGAQIVRPYSIPESDWSYAAASGGILNTTTAVTVKTAGGTGIRNYVTGISLSSEALTNATELAIRDGAAGTVLWRIKIPTAGLPFAHARFASPLRGSANTLLEIVTLTASGAGAVYANLTGYSAP